MNGALYHPWLWVPGHEDSRSTCRRAVTLPASTPAATGSSVHLAPANEPIEGVLDVRVNHTAAEVGHLFAGGVNCIQVRPGRGIRLGCPHDERRPELAAGQRRRGLPRCQPWMERFLSDLVHEPNDVRLWVRIMRELTAHLEGLHARGAARSRRRNPFFVKCDSETNPPDAVAAGSPSSPSSAWP